MVSTSREKARSRFSERAAKGGRARAAKLTAEERSAFARKAAQTRWQDKGEGSPYPRAKAVTFDMGIWCVCGAKFHMTDICAEWFCRSCRRWYRARAIVVRIPTPEGAHPESESRVEEGR